VHGYGDLAHAPAAVWLASAIAISAPLASSVQAAEPPAMTGPRAARYESFATVAVVARRLGVDPALAMAVTWVESRGRAGLEGAAGELGIMQVMPATAGDLGLHDPGILAQSRFNAVAGVAYLKQMLDQFGGRPDVALSAYNSGPGATTRAGGVTPQSRAYVRRAMRAFRRLRACPEDRALAQCLHALHDAGRRP